MELCNVLLQSGHKFRHGTELKPGLQPGHYLTSHMDTFVVFMSNVRLFIFIAN